jgi:hypothetical protein
MEASPQFKSWPRPLNVYSQLRLQIGGSHSTLLPTTRKVISQTARALAWMITAGKCVVGVCTRFPLPLEKEFAPNRQLVPKWDTNRNKFDAKLQQQRL